MIARTDAVKRVIKLNRADAECISIITMWNYYRHAAIGIPYAHMQIEVINNSIESSKKLSVNVKRKNRSVLDLLSTLLYRL